MLTSDLKIGDSITIHLFCKYENIIAVTGQRSRVVLQGKGNVTQWNEGKLVSSDYKKISGTGNLEFLYTFQLTKDHIKNSYWITSLRHDGIKSGAVYFIIMILIIF